MSIVITPALVGAFEAAMDETALVLDALDETSVNEVLCCGNPLHPVAGNRTLAFAIWYAATFDYQDDTDS